MRLQKKIITACLLFFNLHFLYAQEIGWIKAQAIRDNVVSVKSEYGVGFGFIVGEKNNVLYIVTANHVVRGMNDGGPGDKANVSLEFFTEQGSTYSGVLEETWLPSQREDLAVITITTPPRYKWRYEGFSPLRTNVEGTSVWYVGRDGKWEVSDSVGKIIAKTSKGKLYVEGFDIVPGMSGGVIISEYGVEGLIQRKYNKGLEIISLEAIKNFMEAWGDPWGIGGVEKRFSDHEIKSAAGKELIVRDNETLVINAAMGDVIVEKFVMGKNAVIRFEENVREWNVTALKASFDKGALIYGRGWDGYNGSSGAMGDSRLGTTCDDGGDGGNGRDGENGNNGVTIRLKMGIEKIDGLTIDLTGGSGGNGGSGGHGGTGGSSSSYSDGCEAGDGGDGGNGGRGGNGGNGGNLRIEYFFLNDSEKKLEPDSGNVRIISYYDEDPQSTRAQNNIKIRLVSGAGGASGSGATGGSGGTGGFGKKSGNNGRSGNSGGYGQPGRIGTAVIIKM
jgi:hypothetical protein